MTGYRPRRPRLRGDSGFTIIELAIVALFIAILAAIAVAMYGDFQSRARTARAQADARMLASAVSGYASHMGSLPPSLTALTLAQVNAQGDSAGPFVASVPMPPAGWAAYTYVSSTAGTFSVSSSGDNTTVTVP
ncbi:MAG TPA: type II secretion system protein GspG [Methylomirabilota bacterium]|nr:type II secretion system protein GspG [Methylomirabilota bacterium]